MDNCEMECWRDNWNKVVVAGRKPGLELQIGCEGERLSLQSWAHRVFDDLADIALAMDEQVGGTDYHDLCNKLRQWIDNPELTISGQLLALTKQLGGMGEVGCELGSEYHTQRLSHQYETYSAPLMEEEVLRSIEAQQAIERADEMTFDEFLSDYFTYLK